MRGGLAIGTALALAGCAPGALSVDDAWVRLPAAQGRPAAAYLTIHGGERPETLIRITSDVSLRSELHETMTSGSMAAMTPIANVAVPAGGTVAFQPGGRHVMLFGMNPAVKPGSDVILTLTFADGHRVTRKARVVGPADPDPNG